MCFVIIYLCKETAQCVQHMLVEHLATTPRVSLRKVTKCFMRHSLRLIEYLDEKKPACKPTLKWWIILAAVICFMPSVDVCFKSLQGPDILVRQQDACFAHLACGLEELLGTLRPLMRVSSTSCNPEWILRCALASSLKRRHQCRYSCKTEGHGLPAAWHDLILVIETSLLLRLERFC